MKRSARNADGRKTAYCLSCERTRPVTFGYINRPTMAATLDLGGPVNLTRVAHETEVQTFCAVCGHRVITAEEGQRLEERADDEKTKWAVALVICFIVVGIIMANELSNLKH
jgi:hypothetical protein